MITHVVFDGVAEGALGVGIDVVGTAARLVEAGLVPVARRAKPLRQRVVSIDGEPVRSGTGRTVAVDGALSLRGVGVRRPRSIAASTAPDPPRSPRARRLRPLADPQFEVGVRDFPPIGPRDRRVVGALVAQ